MLNHWNVPLTNDSTRPEKLELNFCSFLFKMCPSINQSCVFHSLTFLKFWCTSVRTVTVIGAQSSQRGQKTCSYLTHSQVIERIVQFLVCPKVLVIFVVEHLLNFFYSKNEFQKARVFLLPHAHTHALPHTPDLVSHHYSIYSYNLILNTGDTHLM